MSRRRRKNNKLIQIVLAPELHTQLKVVAASTGVTMQILVVDAITQTLPTYTGKKGAV